MASQHICQRCGHEDECSFGSWPDRHPIMATVGGLFGLTFMGMMFSVYPGGAWTMTGLAAVVFAVRAIGRRRRRREALATRAEWENAAMQTPPPAEPTIRRQPWHAMTHYPTTPMQTAKLPRR